MAGFSKLFLTQAGQALQYKAQGGKTLNFVRFGLGDGNLNGQAISQLTDLISEKLSVNLSKLEIKTNKVVLGCNFNNSSLVSGFYWREIGVFAEDPDTGDEILYMYANASDTPDYIPENGTDVLEKYLDVEMNISNVSTITASIDNSLVLVSVADFNTEKSRVNGLIGGLDGRLDVAETDIENLEAAVAVIEDAIQNIDVSITSETETNITGILKGTGSNIAVSTESDIVAAIPIKAAQWDAGGEGTIAVQQELDLLELELSLRNIIDQWDEGVVVSMSDTSDFILVNGYYDTALGYVYV